jgi:hypothetical protein
MEFKFNTNCSKYKTLAKVSSPTFLATSTSASALGTVVIQFKYTEPILLKGLGIDI